MQGFQSLILFTISCLLTCIHGNVRNDGYACLSRVQWRELWTSLNINFSPDCIFISRRNLRRPDEMIETIASDHAAILQVLHEIGRLLNEAENSFPRVTEFLMLIHQKYDHLKTCLGPNIYPSSHTDYVTAHFQDLRAFLDNRQNSHCAWQRIIMDSIVMIQRLGLKNEN